MNAIGPAAVYSLCLVTSVICAALLTRAYLRSRSRLLLWTAVSFLGLALNNLLLVGDLILFPEIDMRIWRQLASAAAIGVLLYGFVWDAER